MIEELLKQMEKEEAAPVGPPVWRTAVASDDEIFAVADAIKAASESEQGSMSYLCIARIALETAAHLRGRIIHDADWRHLH